MSERDRTQQKLIDSIRKTKSAAAKSSAPSKLTKPVTSEKQPAATKRASPKPKVAPARGTVDPYRSGRRVWPD